MNKAIFTDQDGVIRKLVMRDGRYSYAQTKDELEFFPLVKQGVELAHERGFKVFIVSNQPTSCWKQTEDQDDWLHYMTSLLVHTFQFDDVMFAKDRGSRFYKPNPDMILEMAAAHDIDLTKSWMIGDMWRDCVAAKLAKVNYVHIKGEDPIGPFYSIENSFYDAIAYITRWSDFEEKLNGGN